MSYSPEDAQNFYQAKGGPLTNLIGPGGILISEFLFTFFGVLAYLLPLAFLVFSIFCLLSKKIGFSFIRVIGSLIGFLSASALLGVLNSKVGGGAYPLGGLLGSALALALLDLVSVAGTLTIATAGLFISLLFLFQRSLAHLLGNLFCFGKFLLWPFGLAWEKLSSIKFPKAKRAQSIALKEPKIVSAEKISNSPRGNFAIGALDGVRKVDKEFVLARSENADDTKPQFSIGVQKPQSQKAREFEVESLKIVERDDAKGQKAVIEAEMQRTQVAQEYELPGLSLLDYDAPPKIEVDENKMRAQAEKLSKTFANFGIEGQIREIRLGPVVTSFEFVPAPGIKLSKIAALADDIAMAMEAVHVRVVAPIPGKGAVGIEIPNEVRETVYLKEI